MFRAWIHLAVVCAITLSGGGGCDRAPARAPADTSPDAAHATRTVQVESLAQTPPC